MASLMPTGKQQYFDPSTGAPLAGGKLFTYVGGTSTPKDTWQDAGATIKNQNPIPLDTTGSAVVFWSGNYKVQLQDSLGNVIYTVDNYSTDSRDHPVQVELQTASAGQTTFLLTQTTYTPGINSLHVYVDGLRVIMPDYAETSSTVVTFASPLALGQLVMFECGSAANSQSSLDASIIPYTPGGGGAVTNVAAALNGKVNTSNIVFATQFGAKGDGTTDDTSALTALAAYVNAIQLNSRPVSIRFSQGVYKYTDGLWFKRPVTILADGATLNYLGTGKALELGADGIANFDVFLQGEYTVDGLRFTGGATATHGVYVNDYVIEPRIRNCTFEDYGNSTSIDIFSQFQVWDVLVENCRKLTYSSTTAVGNFIAITGRNKANTADDGGNSRVTIRDCWMTSYSNQEMGYFAYVNAVKSRIIGGGFQHSNGGIRLGGNASFTTIDNVYSEISTTSAPYYITVLSNDAGGGNFSWPQGVVIKGGYANMHSDAISNTGRIIKVGDANAKLLNWKIDGFSVANYANGQVLIEQNDLTGQTGNRYGGIVRYYNPAVLDDGHRFALRGTYTNAEKWASFDVEKGVWTPTLGGTSTYTTQTGKFVRNGNTVTVSFDVQVNALGTGNTSQLFGLPYSCGSLTCAGEIGYYNSLALSVYSLNARADGGNNWITFTGMTAAATGVAGSLAIFGNAARVIGTLSYIVDDPL